MLSTKNALKRYFMICYLNLTDSSQQRLYRQSVLARNSIYLSSEIIK